MGNAALERGGCGKFFVQVDRVDVAGHRSEQQQVALLYLVGKAGLVANVEFVVNAVFKLLHGCGSVARGWTGAGPASRANRR